MSNLKKNPFADVDETAEFDITSGALQVYQYIHENLPEQGNPQFVDRGSSATLCVRRRWYQRMGELGTPLTPRKIINFTTGDIVERVLAHFVEEACVGPDRIYSEVYFGETVGYFPLRGKKIKIHKQFTLSFDLDGQRITCHADGFGRRVADGQWELIEFKSAASYGYADFTKEDGGPGDYLKQAHASMLCDELSGKGRTYSRWERVKNFLLRRHVMPNLGVVRTVRYFYQRKDTGQIHDRAFGFTEAMAQTVCDEYRQVRKPLPPDAPHDLAEETYYKKPTGRMIAKFPCSYCPFLRQCKGAHEKVFKKDQFGNYKPVFVFGDKEKSDEETA